MAIPASVSIRIDAFSIGRNSTAKPITIRFLNTRFLDHPKEGIEFDLTEEEAISIASAITKVVIHGKKEQGAL